MSAQALLVDLWAELRSFTSTGKLAIALLSLPPFSSACFAFRPDARFMPTPARLAAAIAAICQQPFSCAPLFAQASSSHRLLSVGAVPFA